VPRHALLAGRGRQLTTASGGYMKNINKWYTLLAEYSHYFYHQPSDSTVSVPYTNNVGMSNYFEVGKFVFRLDYYLNSGAFMLNGNFIEINQGVLELKQFKERYE
jgi:hypothetical protein